MFPENIHFHPNGQWKFTGEGGLNNLSFQGRHHTIKETDFTEISRGKGGGGTGQGEDVLNKKLSLGLSYGYFLEPHIWNKPVYTFIDVFRAVIINTSAEARVNYLVDTSAYKRESQWSDSSKIVTFSEWKRYSNVHNVDIFFKNLKQNIPLIPTYTLSSRFVSRSQL